MSLGGGTFTPLSEGLLCLPDCDLFTLLLAQEEYIQIDEMEFGQKKEIQDVRNVWLTSCLMATLKGLDGEERGRGPS